MTIPVGLDANALTYLVEAMSGSYTPTTDTSPAAPERLSMYRIFLYGDSALCLSPTVAKQYEAIQNDARRDFHWDVHQFHIIDAAWNADSQSLNQRVAELCAAHPDGQDCRIAAEAERTGLRWLLSFDRRFASRLNPHLRSLEVVAPSKYWNSLHVPKGSRPRVQPAPANPLRGAAWWAW